MKAVEVAAGVLLRADGKVLLGQRPASKVYAGFWEFPGGKVEAGETPLAALKRELCEELDIEIRTAYPWIVRTFTYPHATVELRFFCVRDWRGEPRAKEHQAITWQQPGALQIEPMLPANGPILRALALPSLMAISDIEHLGERVFLERLADRLKRGLRFLQLREKAMTHRDLITLGRRVVALCRQHRAIVTVNEDEAAARAIDADGVHLPAARLLDGAHRRPQFAWVGASCHNAEELAGAVELGADLAVVGPVKATRSHPGAIGIGWERLRSLIHGSPIPIYAIGGLRTTDMEQAWQSGAHGIAMIRGSWDPD